MKPESSSENEEHIQEESVNNELPNNDEIVRHLVRDDEEMEWQLPLLAIACAFIGFLCVAMLYCCGKEHEHKTICDSHSEQLNSGLLNEIITVRS